MASRLKLNQSVNQGGQMLILTAFALAVLIGIVGLAVDSGRGYGVKAKLNSAVDAAAIAGARALATGLTDDIRIANAKAAAQNYYAANFPAGYLGATRGPLSLTAVHSANGYWTVTANANAIMPVSFLGVLGLQNVNVTAVGQTHRRDLDLILVMDTSGSLKSPSSTFPTLRDAAINFVKRFNPSSNGDRVGLVSFASGGVVDVAIVKDGSRGFNQTQVINAINALSPDGVTASAEGMRLALNEINGVPAAKRSSLRAIVFFSDGAPNTVPADFVDNSNKKKPVTVTGDLFSETDGPGSSKASEVYRHDRRNSQIDNYDNIDTLPSTGFAITGGGNVPLASYNGQRSLTGSPVTNTRCNVNKAARNMVENIGNTVRSQGIKIYAVGLGATLNSNEIGFCSYGIKEWGANILKRLANAADADTYNAAQPQGLYVYAANANELNDAFNAIASELLRLSM